MATKTRPARRTRQSAGAVSRIAARAPAHARSRVQAHFGSAPASSSRASGNWAWRPVGFPDAPRWPWPQICRILSGTIATRASGLGSRRTATYKSSPLMRSAARAVTSVLARGEEPAYDRLTRTARDHRSPRYGAVLGGRNIAAASGENPDPYRRPPAAEAANPSPGDPGAMPAPHARGDATAANAVVSNVSSVHHVVATEATRRKAVGWPLTKAMSRTRECRHPQGRRRAGSASARGPSRHGAD